MLSLTSTSQVDADEPFSIFVVNNCLRCERIQTTDLLQDLHPGDGFLFSVNAHINNLFLNLTKYL